MAKINLLPWRQELRRQQIQDFLFVTLLFAALGAVGAGVFYLALREQIRNQEQRNGILASHVSVLDAKIVEIEQLEEKKSALLARMDAIELLQTNRPSIVKLFDQLQSALPEGASYTSLRQSGTLLTIDGLAESEARVSSFMRGLERSSFFSKPTLKYIRIKDIGGEGESLDLRVNEFSLEVRQVSSTRVEGDS